MCRSATVRTLATVCLLTLVVPLAAQVQSAARADRVAKLDWRRVGNTGIDLGLPGIATGPVDRVSYSGDGARLYARTTSGRTFETTDFEHWMLSSTAPFDTGDLSVANRPEPRARFRAAATDSNRIFAAGSQAWRSDDGGLNWRNLTAYQGRSILGDALSDVAVSPRDADELVVAGPAGLWRSVDGGLSWTGINQNLPNLPVKRFSTMQSADSIRIVTDDTGRTVEWIAGERSAWRPVESQELSIERRLRGAASTALRTEISAIATAGDVQYAGSADGRLFATTDSWRNFTVFPTANSNGTIRLYADSADPRWAVAVLGGLGRSRVFRTNNAGAFWDDLTENLPPVQIRSVTGDRASGSVYLATDAGVFYGYGDAAGPLSGSWLLAKAGEGTPAMDVMLDGSRSQIFVAFEGSGVFAALAPHRLRDPRVLNAGDFSARPAAPGALLSIVGSKVTSAWTAGGNAPVLSATDTQSQIQVPFEAAGDTLTLLADAELGRLTFGLPLRRVSPAIFVDREGSPLVMNADTGLVLDPGSPARSGTRLQIFTTGLGKVKPDWPAGVPAPVEAPPRVVAQIQVFLDREPLRVTRAMLAPGYVGLYLVEIQLPEIVNLGPAELYVEAEGQQSNRVRVFLEP